MRNKFFATTRLMRLYLRQHRIFMLIWLLVPGLWVVINILSSRILFPTEQSLIELGKTLNDPLTIAMHGAVLDISIAGFVTWRTKVFAVILSGIFSIIYVVRHTRLAEEQGKRELLGANCVGSLSPLAAAIANMALINAAMTVFMVLGMSAAGLGFTGSLAHCLAIFTAACFFGCAGGVMAQLFVSGSAARNASFGVLAALMAIHILWNAKGVAGGVMLLSPLEWPLLIRPFAGEQFWVLLIALFMTLVFAALALVLMDRRDMGAGIFSQRGGRATARPGFKTPLALSWRIQKGMFFIWLGFFAVFSFALGSAAELLGSSISSAEALAGIIEKLGGVDKAFMSLMLYVFAILISVYCLMSAGILRGEESARGETFLSLPVKRSGFCLSHLLFVFLGTAVIALVSGIGVGLGAALSTGTPGEFTRLLLEMVRKIPAIWVMGGLAVFFFGLLPGWMNGASFALLVLFVMLEVLWEQQSISAAVYGLSPFSYVYPANDVAVFTLAGLCLVSAALAILGLYLFKRRDLQT
ncbi:hypothetical protein Psfp_02282 [Pelotomaculum sp. FP]|uniref:ABC transporter permease n=1 Tax=Pelotomaculum sp. FP TaxID=261474 RepID=UPI0010664AD6|nr:ABC transporter [Pelotomaculum sp. FP]TEB15245.1 hypothetical protein Psfp_02282 [Pelotomaculum sp. FP]